MANTLQESLPLQSQVSPKELTAHRASLDALTGIRFFAAFYVVLYHSHLSNALSDSGHKPASNFIANGYLAVSLFFLLSGFILSYTYRGQMAKQTGSRRFWEARFARVWPLYVISLLLSTVIMHTTPPPGRAIATLFMVQAWNPLNIDMAGSWNFVCWTLSAEAMFYLIFPFIQPALGRHSQRRQAVNIALLIALSIALGTGRHVFDAPTQGIFAYIPLAVVRIPEFVIGMCLGNLFLLRNASLPLEASKTRLIPGLPDVLTWIAAAASVALLCQAPGPVVTLSVATFAALLFGLATERSFLQRFLSTRWMLIGGQISYGMYLLQWPCKMAISRACDHLHLRSMPLRMLLDVIALIAVSSFTFYLVETPARKFIRAGFARVEALRAGVVTLSTG